MKTPEHTVEGLVASLQFPRRILALILLAIALEAMSLASPAGAFARTAPVHARKTAPDFTLTDSQGTPVRLSDYKGRVVLLDFWATWCHGCKTEIPWYMEFDNKYKDRGLTVIGVSMDKDGWKSVKPFIKLKKMNYTIVIGNAALAKQYGLTSMPMTLLIDRDGRIVDSHVGIVDKAAWESEIKTLLRDRDKRAAVRVPQSMPTLDTLNALTFL